MIFDFLKSKEPSNIVPFPVPKYGEKDPPMVKTEPKEHYRVGFTDDGMTTLTFMSGSSTMTLSMNRGACEQLIKMLRSTYSETSKEQDENI